MFLVDDWGDVERGVRGIMWGAGDSLPKTIHVIAVRRWKTND